MGQSPDYVALDWVRSEIDTTLGHARQALEAYADTPDSTRMRSCLTYIHQVHGTLQIVELHGLAELSEEMEQLAQAMMNNEVEDSESVQQILMQSILELPASLERVRRGSADSVQVVRPMVNELRRARGASLLEVVEEPATVRASADLSSLRRGADSSAVTNFDNANGQVRAQKMRRAFQQSLLALHRGEELERVYVNLGKLFVALARLCAGSAHAYQWAAFAALAEGLVNGSIEFDDGIGALLRRVDVEIKKLASDGRDAVTDPVDEALMADVLAVLAGVKKPTGMLRDILKRFRVGVKQSDSQATAGGNREAVVAVAINLREELAAVLDRIDLFVRSSERDHSSLGELIPSLTQMARSLKMAGLPRLQRRLMEQMVVLQGFAKEGGDLAQEGRDDSKLMDIAAGLLRVDASLEKMVESDGTTVSEDDDVQLSDAQAGVIREARSGLEEVKRAIVEFISSQWNDEKLADVPDVMRSVRGGLLMVPVPRAAELLEACCEHVETQLMGKGETPDEQMLDTLADAITSIDYYLERLFEDPKHPQEKILDVAAESVAKLRGEEGSDEIPAGAATAGAVTVAVDLPSSTTMPAGNGPEALEHEPGSEERPDSSAVTTSEPGAPSEVDASDDFVIDESFEGAEAKDIAPIADEQAAEPAEFVIDESFDGAEAKDTAQIADEEAAAPAEFVIDESFDGAADGSQPGGDVASGDPFVDDESFEEDTALAVQANEQPLEASEVDDPQVAASEEAPTEVELSEETVIADPEIIEIFLEEVTDVLATLEEVVPRWMSDLGDAEARAEVRRAFHTLKGSGRMVGASLVSEVSWSIENMLNRVIDGTVAASQDMVALVLEVCEAMPILQSSFEQHTASPVDPAPYMERADLFASGAGAMPVASEPPVEKAPSEQEKLPAEPQSEAAQEEAKTEEPQRESGPLSAYPPDAPTIVSHTLPAIDESLLGIFEEEAAQHFEVIQRCVDETGAIDAAVVRALHTLKGSAAMAEIPDIVGIAAPLEDFAGELANSGGAVDEGGYVILRAGLDAMRACLGALVKGIDPTFSVNQFHDILSRGEHNVATDMDESQDSAAESEEHQAPQDSEPVSEPAGQTPSALPEPPASVPAAMETAQAIVIPDDVDPEVLEIFYEEADELLESIDQSIQDWLQHRTSREPVDALLRALHTLKGGARLAGLARLGDYTHEFESHLIEQQPNFGDLSDAFFAEFQTRHDVLVSYVSAIKSGVPGETVTIEGPAPSPSSSAAEDSPREPTPMGHDEQAQTDAQPEQAEQAETAQVPDTEIEEADNNVIAFASAPQQEGEVLPSEPAEAEQVPLRQAPQEMVRVASTLLEDLVNLAGETSIHRARVEQEIRDFGSALEETETTIERLRDQLRQLELETDAQVLYRQERTDGPGYADFDPLEMDRYSQLQQLSRSLLESASDLFDLKDTLSSKTRDAEALLIHQARINTELQEGLMRTRMVPFERLVPRLRRIVRQIGRELNKEVAFEAFDAEGELDRNVLERMIPPFEHMLRNAVDHGIESAEEREAAGKPKNGKITLRLSREAGDIVMEIADDGRGVDVEKVREKAIQRGLMPEDAGLADEDIVQFIMSPGFSTAQTVTQISGRGVGMDVVDSEVKMLGGEISISSEAGKGTTFTVRLPFTLSVNRALMVMVGDDLYAIPLNTIEGIVRVLPRDLEPYLEQSVTTFEYAGARYRMRYLGSYVGQPHYTRTDAMSVPVILVRAGGEAVALYVDAVQGSREIVVKGLGPQFASVGGISGATILGDGNVVVILDPPGLIRAEAAARLRPPEVATVADDDKGGRATRVMVVDDSVTVRKVTSRVLERNGFEVMLAKDGVDAIAMLQERRPDIMLLDIEMPRMDGFEVARLVRRDERLEGLPIVIISSRTGSKHQDRARELGVNVFMGKPFQENVLLKIIGELVG